MNFHSLARRDLQFLCKKNRIPANLTNVAMAKALEALKTVEGIGEIQEALGIRSPKVNSPELPHIGQKIFTRGVTHGDEPKTQQQQEPSPMPRSHRVTVKTLQVTKMASNEEEVQEKLGFRSLNVKSPELPHTARRTSARKAAYREKPSPLHRSCLKSSIALEEEGEKKKVPQILPKTPATRKAARGVEAQSSRRIVKRNEDVERHTKTPKDIEAKGEKAIGVVTRRSTRLSSRKALEESVTTQFKSKSSSRKDSAVKMEAFAKEEAGEGEKEEVKKDLVKYGEIENECEATYENAHDIQQEKGRLHPPSNRVNTKALEATKMVPKEDDDKKVTIVDLIEEKAGEQEKEEDERELAEKSDWCAVALVEANTEEDKKEESHGYSSSSEVKNDDSIAPQFEEVEENCQEVENLCFSSSTTQVEDSNIEEIENGDSTVALVEGDEKHDEELEIQVSSFSIEMQDSNVEIESDVFNVVHVEEEGRNDQEESHELSSFHIENSMEHCNDQSPENDLVDDSSNIVPTNEAVKYSVDNSSEAKLASSSLSDNLLCIEVTLFPHEEAIQTSSGIEEEARKLSLLVTQMTLKEAKLIFSENIDAITNSGDEVSTTEASGEIPREVMESGGVLTSEVSVAIGETIDADLSNAGALSAIDSVDAQGNSFESRILVSSIELCTEISAADSTIEWPDKNANELPVLIKESFEDSITDSSELTANGFVDVRQKDYFFELQIPVSSAELCSDFLTVDSTIESHRVDHFSENLRESVEDGYLHKLPANESFKVSQNTKNCQSVSFNLQNPVSCTELCFELSTVDSDFDFNESFGNLSSEISGSIDEYVAAGLLNSDEIPSEKSVYAQTSHAASYEPQILVPSPADLCVEFSSSEISGSIDESVAAGLPKSDEFTYEKFIYAETSQDASSEPQIHVPSPAELCVEFSSTLETICSPLKLPCASKTRSLLEPSIVQTQSCEQVPIATTKMTEEKEETMIKASEKEVFLKGESLELMSLRKLRAMYKQMMNSPKTEEKKRSMMIKQQDLEFLSRSKLDSSNKQKLNYNIKKSEKKRFVIKQQQDLECLSCNKLDSTYKQKLNDDITMSEKKRSGIKQQQDLECLSRSKLDSNNKQKLNDEFIKSERKRTPLKNLNYQIEF